MNHSESSVINLIWTKKLVLLYMYYRHFLIKVFLNVAKTNAFNHYGVRTDVVRTNVTRPFLWSTFCPFLIEANREKGSNQSHDIKSIWIWSARPSWYSQNFFRSLFLWVIYQQSDERLVFHFRQAENSSLNFFSSEKNPENPEITSRCHQPSTPSPPNYKPVGTLAGSSTPSSTEEPPHTKPSYSGPKPPHCSFPPMALQATDHQLQTK